MKKVYIICLFMAIIFGVCAYLYSYQYFIQTNKEDETTGINMTVETVQAAVQEEEKLTKDTLFYIETYNIEKNTIIREPAFLPTEVIGNNRKQFTEYLENMMEKHNNEKQDDGLLSIELTTFGEQEVVVRKTYREEKNKCEFYLDVQMGRVIVRNSDDSLYAYTEIKFETLPEDLKRKILHGYSIENLEELYEFLETYSS